MDERLGANSQPRPEYPAPTMTLLLDHQGPHTCVGAQCQGMRRIIVSH